MSKKKTTKVRKMWTGTKQVIEMGNEIPQDEMKANEIYSVLMISKGEKDLCFEWGIVVTDNFGDIYRNYNINQKGKWEANPCAIKNRWHVYQATGISRELANLYLTVITLNKSYTELKYKHEHMSLWERIMNR